MSRLFGDVRQLGYVVPDIHAAMRHWADVLGIGPWFYTGCNRIENGIINGKSASFSVNIALANSGDMQIELIEPVEGPSPYHDFLDQTDGVGGLQHLSSWPSKARFEEIVETFERAGGNIVIRGAMAGTQFVYLDTLAQQGTLFELAALSEQSKRFFDRVKDASIAWDGSDPIIPVGAGKAEQPS